MTEQKDESDGNQGDGAVGVAADDCHVGHDAVHVTLIVGDENSAVSVARHDRRQANDDKYYCCCCCY